MVVYLRFVSKGSHSFPMKKNTKPWGTTDSSSQSYKLKTDALFFLKEKRETGSCSHVWLCPRWASFFRWQSFLSSMPTTPSLSSSGSCHRWWKANNDNGRWFLLSGSAVYMLLVKTIECERGNIGLFLLFSVCTSLNSIPHYLFLVHTISSLQLQSISTRWMAGKLLFK